MSDSSFCKVMHQQELLRQYKFELKVKEAMENNPDLTEGFIREILHRRSFQELSDKANELTGDMDVDLDSKLDDEDDGAN